MTSDPGSPAGRPASTDRLLDGKVAVVTGVTSGAGRGIASVFASRGAAVVGMARRRELGEALERDVDAAGGELTFVAGDVTRAADCDAAVQRALDRYGRLDAVVNNAGTAGPRPVEPAEEVEELDWRAVLDVNLTGTFLMCRAALPHLLAQGDGVILNVASINAVVGVANMAAYNSSKAGVVQLSRTLAVENAGRGVRVNAVILGGVRTDTAAEIRTAMARHVLGPEAPLPDTGPARGVDPEEVGRALSLLCTDDARMITGAAIELDGALTAGGPASKWIYQGAAGRPPG